MKSFGAFGFCVLTVASAQAPEEVRIRTGPWFPPGMVISANTNLVELVATVRDRQGRLVEGLKAEAFEVFDKGQAREIAVFSESKGEASTTTKRPTTAAAAGVAATPPSAQQRSIALFFDDAHASMFGVRKSADAARRLFTDSLTASDMVGIFTSSGKVSVDFTNDRARITAALDALRPSPIEGGRGTTSCPTLTPDAAHLIWRHLDPDTTRGAMLDAANCYCQPVTPKCIEEQRPVVEAAAQNVWEQTRYRFSTTLEALEIVIRHLAAAPEKRMLLMMSPGFPTGGMGQAISRLVDSALRANIRISAVNSEGLGFLRVPIKLARSEFMTEATHSTGGKYVYDTNDISGALASVAAVPEVSYTLVFSHFPFFAAASSTIADRMEMPSTSLPRPKQSHARSKWD